MPQWNHRTYDIASPQTRSHSRTDKCGGATKCRNRCISDTAAAHVRNSEHPLRLRASTYGRVTVPARADGTSGAWPYGTVRKAFLPPPHPFPCRPRSTPHPPSSALCALATRMQTHINSHTYGTHDLHDGTVPIIGANLHEQLPLYSEGGC